MPVSTKVSRSSAGAGSSRFARSASAPRRPGRASTSGQSRFARPTSTSTSRRSNAVQGLRRRGQPQPTGLKKVLSAVLPTAGTAKKAAPSSKKGKAGGLALVAAAAGMAFKNRDKLSDLRRKDSDEAVTPVTNNAATPPSTPIA